MSDTIRNDHDLRSPYYCEENVWLLAFRKLYFQTKNINDESDKNQDIPPDNKDKSRYYVAFISNQLRCVPMMFQKASPSPSTTACRWDYHVILLSVRDQQQNQQLGKEISLDVFVHDVDTTLMPYPVPLVQYLNSCWPNHDRELLSSSSPPDLYAPLFRVIPAECFLRDFCSDRRHMYNATTQTWNAPRPSHQCIQQQSLLVPKQSNETSNTNSEIHNAATGKSNLELYLNFGGPTKRLGDGKVNYGNDEVTARVPSDGLGVILTLHQLKIHCFS